MKGVKEYGFTDQMELLLLTVKHCPFSGGAILVALLLSLDFLQEQTLTRDLCAEMRSVL